MATAARGHEDATATKGTAMSMRTAKPAWKPASTSTDPSSWTRRPLRA